MSATIDELCEKLASLEDAGEPPSDITDLDALLTAANELAAKRRTVFDLLETLSVTEKADLLARPGVSTKLSKLLASTRDWSRALARGRDAASARVAAVRNLRQRRSQR